MCGNSRIYSRSQIPSVGPNCGPPNCPTRSSGSTAGARRGRGWRGVAMAVVCGWSAAVRGYGVFAARALGAGGLGADPLGSCHFLAKFRSFSAVSAPIFARKYAFFSIFQNLPDYLSEIFGIRFWQNFADFATLKNNSIFKSNC